MSSCAGSRDAPLGVVLSMSMKGRTASLTHLGAESWRWGWVGRTTSVRPEVATRRTWEHRPVHGHLVAHAWVPVHSEDRLPHPQAWAHICGHGGRKMPSAHMRAALSHWPSLKENPKSEVQLLSIARRGAASTVCACEGGQPSAHALQVASPEVVRTAVPGAMPHACPSSEPPGARGQPRGARPPRSGQSAQRAVRLPRPARRSVSALCVWGAPGGEVQPPAWQQCPHADTALGTPRTKV